MQVTTFRADGTAIRLPGLSKRLTWLIDWPLLKRWMSRMRGRYVWCAECGVAIPADRYEFHEPVHLEHRISAKGNRG